MQFDAELNAVGLNCPLPILKARKAIDGLDRGEIIKITATDPGSVRDFDAFCRQTGHDLLDHEQADGQFVFFVRKN